MQSLGVLLLLGIIVLAVWAFSDDKSKQKQLDLQRRNQDWINFIAGYAHVAQSAKEKALVQRMLGDIAAQRLGQPSTAVASSTATYAQGTASIASVVQQQPMQPDSTASEKARVQLDNASLLLYFGAFLFVASSGLFVAFGGANGVVRTLIVLFVSLALYGGGIWLHNNRPKLKQAGQAFAGIGIVLAPLVGSALYAYVFNRSQGTFVWLLTSLFCLAMYAHALLVFRTALMGYVLIFTFLSLFESGVGVVHAPLYYYGWGLAVVGIGLQLLQRWKGWLPELREASSQSAMVFIPGALVASFIMVSSQGATQLGVSLLLAAAFYGLEVLRTKGYEQEVEAIATQVATVLGVATLTYGVSGSWFAVGVSLLAVNAAQLLLVGFYNVGGKLWHNYGTVLLVMASGAVFVAIPHYGLVLAAVLAVFVTAVILQIRQRREDAYGLATISWLAVPYVAGQLTFGPLSAAWQTAAGLLAVLGVLVVYVVQNPKTRSSPGTVTVAGVTYTIGAASVLVCSLFAAPIVMLGAAVVLAATFLVLARRDHNDEWVDVAGTVLVMPLLHTWGSRSVFLLSAIIALGSLALLAIRYRRELLRWASTFVWLLLPIALGHAQVGGHWTTLLFAWAYVLAMVGLIISRAVARGVVYLSSKVPLSSYTRNASISYVVGYTTAAILAVCISLAVPDGQSQLHTTVILGVLVLTTIVLSRYIEKRDDLLSFLPVLGQAFLLSAIHPHRSQSAYSYVVLSSALAIAMYAFFSMMYGSDSKRAGLQSAMRVSLVAAFVAPLSVIFGVQPNWTMALTLLAAGVLLQYHLRASRQADKEMAGGVIVLAAWWFLSFAGVHALQAYTHVLVAMFGLYAYWRYARGEREQSDQYLWWTIGVATVPLALQALAGAGAVYGWWLLLEQVAIMLVGMTVQRGFVTRWGLYVAVAAVLYQLRGLGYAALGFLALFLIALAIYKLQKYNDQR